MTKLEIFLVNFDAVSIQKHKYFHIKSVGSSLLIVEFSNRNSTNTQVIRYYEY